MTIGTYATLRLPTLYWAAGSRRLRHQDLQPLFETPVGLSLDRLSEAARTIVAVSRTGGPFLGQRFLIPSIEDGADALGHERYQAAAATWRAVYGSHCDRHVQTRRILIRPLRRGDDPEEMLNTLAETPGLCVRSTPSDAWTIIDEQAIRPNDWTRAWEHMLRNLAGRLERRAAVAA